MRRLILLISIPLWLNSQVAQGQHSKKEVIKYPRLTLRLDTAKIKKGEQLEYANRYSVKKFIEYQIEYGERLEDKKWGTMRIEQLYKDSINTYFGRNSDLGLMTFFWVKNDELEELHYRELDVVALREKFFEEIVPESDKESVKKKARNYVPGVRSWDFKYNYHPDSRLLEMTYRWKVEGRLTAAINKTYKANYDLHARQFVK
jgi:hypothetical protein